MYVHIFYYFSIYWSDTSLGLGLYLIATKLVTEVQVTTLNETS